VASKADIDKLKRDAGLTPFISRGLKKGVQKCIFHDDSTASLSVNEDGDGGYFNCFGFGCKKAGDVIKLIQLVDVPGTARSSPLSFPKALDTLRKEIGIQDDKQPPFAFDQAAAAARLKEVMPFLLARGITEDIAIEAGLGAYDFPGVGLMVSIPYRVKQNGLDVVLFRAITPSDPSKKWRHVSGTSTDALLYGAEILDSAAFAADPTLMVLESALDSLTVKGSGRNAVSVSSATSSLTKGKLKYDAALLKKISDTAEHINIATDMDAAGAENATAWLNEMPKEKVHRIIWKYGGKGSGDPKDVGEVYLKSPDTFADVLTELEREALKPPWHLAFHRLDELPDGDPAMLIEGILPEGTTMVGALSGVGKTWVLLSLAKALTNGTPFMGQPEWKVTEPRNVLYLIPESGAKAFKKRARKMGVNEDGFFCQTMSDGRPMSLQDPVLAMAIRDLHPVVMLDTVIRFEKIQDENSSAQSSQNLAVGIFGMLTLGAPAVVGAHHAPKKATGDHGRTLLTLESALRGTGDIGAMSDCVWAIQHDFGGDGEGIEYLQQSKNLMRLFLRCVKPRDIEPPPGDFRIVGRDTEGRPSHLDTGGDFHVLAYGESKSRAERKGEQMAAYLQSNALASKKALADMFKVSEKHVADYLELEGYVWQGPAKKGQKGRFVRQEEQPDEAADEQQSYQQQQAPF